MCGIAGFSWKDDRAIARMTETIAHRGPDDYAIYTDDQVSLGFQRLSIIDLSERGRQPMSNEDGTVWVVFNGEIYNFQEIRPGLEARGHVFRSRTDTEVIVHAYEEYGPRCVERFNGMFAFAIWDSSRRELFIARDRLGIKPLYYYFKDGRLAFASEIKAILENPEVEREINYQSLYYYIGYEFVPAPDTIFRNIYKLPPGHFMTFRDGDLKVTKYWDLRFESEPHPQEYYQEQIREMLTESVRKRLISDVPLGVFLSGGLDSSALVALMSRCGVNPIKTFSLGYDDPTFSELGYAEVVARQFDTEHHVLMIDPVTPELIEKAVWHLDEPMTDLSTVPFYIICQKAREHVKVCLSGEGGDEVMVGYDRFRASKLNSFYGLIPGLIRRGLIAPLVNALPDQPQKKGAINMLKRFIEGGLLPSEGEHIRWQFFGTPEHDQYLFSPDIVSAISFDAFAPLRACLGGFSAPTRLDREIYLDLRAVLPDSPLMKVDKMSMAHGLEVRVPFLDYEFVEMCATIPGNLKLKGLTTKSIFRSAMKGILPDAIVGRGKQGYSLPLKNWLRNEMREYMRDVLFSSPLVKEALNPAYIRRLVEEHLGYRANHNHILWALMNLSIWHRQFVEAPRPQLEPGRLSTHLRLK